VSHRTNTESLTSAAENSYKFYMDERHSGIPLSYASIWLTNDCYLLTSWFVFSVHDFVFVHRRLTPAINRKSQYWNQISIKKRHLIISVNNMCRQKHHFWLL